MVGRSQAKGGGQRQGKNVRTRQAMPSRCAALGEPSEAASDRKKKNGETEVQSRSSASRGAGCAATRPRALAARAGSAGLFCGFTSSSVKKVRAVSASLCHDPVFSSPPQFLLNFLLETSDYPIIPIGKKYSCVYSCLCPRVPGGGAHELFSRALGLLERWVS